MERLKFPKDGNRADRDPIPGIVPLESLPVRFCVCVPGMGSTGAAAPRVYLKRSPPSGCSHGKPTRGHSMAHRASPPAASLTRIRFSRFDTNMEHTLPPVNRSALLFTIASHSQQDAADKGRTAHARYMYCEQIA